MPKLRTLLREQGKDFGFSFDNLTAGFRRGGEAQPAGLRSAGQGCGFPDEEEHIDVHMGTATSDGRDTVAVTDQDGKSSELKTKNIVVATGASVAVPPGWRSTARKLSPTWKRFCRKSCPSRW